MKDNRVWLWAVGAVCGVPLLVIAVVGGVGLRAFFGLDGALVVSIAVAASVLSIRSLVTSRKKTRTG